LGAKDEIGQIWTNEQRRLTTCGRFSCASLRQTRLHFGPLDWPTLPPDTVARDTLLECLWWYKTQSFGGHSSTDTLPQTLLQRHSFARPGERPSNKCGLDNKNAKPVWKEQKPVSVCAQSGGPQSLGLTIIIGNFSPVPEHFLRPVAMRQQFARPSGCKMVAKWWRPSGGELRGLGGRKTIHKSALGRD